MDRQRRGSNGEHRWVRNVALASQVGIFLAVAIAIGWFIGQWLDARLGTTPWLTVLFTLLGTAAGFIELFRVALRIVRDEEQR
ncbi:MAG: AtpZ/AtpI family protein [Armatimonadetes bacterium]|jgi:ATP synthase protein I|nr:AtpZ/AtpI family protein [Armatimonadota bacterium]